MADNLVESESYEAQEFKEHHHATLATKKIPGLWVMASACIAVILPRTSHRSGGLGGTAPNTFSSRELYAEPELPTWRFFYWEANFFLCSDDRFLLGKRLFSPFKGARG